jgi:membrane protease YdiL (CAAX protease family)
MTDNQRSERQMWEEDDDPKLDQELIPPGPATFVRSALIFYGGMGCGALLWRMSSPGESILHPSSTIVPGATLSFAIASGIVLGLIAVGLSELLTRYTELGETLADTLGESLAGISTAEAVLLAVASGIAEEMLFRGALQPSVGIFWASVAFGACHFLPRKELALWSLYAVGMGFALGLLFESTGQLVAPIAAHTVINGINLPRLARRASEREETLES